MKQRMDILLASNVINQETYDGIELAVNTLNKEWKLDSSNQQFQMAMTHLARASIRIKQGEAILEGLDAEIFQEIIEDEAFIEIENMNIRLCQFMQLDNVPNTENSFFLSNLFSMHRAK